MEYKSLKEVKEKIDELIEECKDENWDGYNGAPLSKEAGEYAKQLLSEFKMMFPMPEIGPEPSGHIGLEWYFDNNDTVVVSLDENGHMDFVSRIDGKYESGECPFGQRQNSLVIAAIYMCLARYHHGTK